MIGLGLAVLTAFSFPARAAKKSECPASSVDDIRVSYGKAWGNVSAQRGIGSDESAPIFKALVAYYSCVAAEANQPALCDQLAPISSAQWTLAKSCRNDMDREAKRIKVERDKSEKLELEEKARLIKFNFIKFMAGSGDPRACNAMCQAFPEVVKSFGDESALCLTARIAAQKNGFQTFCAELMKLRRPGAADEAACRGNFAAQASDCGGDAECKERVALYKALKSGAVAQCPKAYADLCKGRPKPLLAAPPSLCASLAQSALRTFCGLFQIASERTGGAVGVTDADVEQTQQLNRQMRSLKESAH